MNKNTAADIIDWLIPYLEAGGVGAPKYSADLVFRALAESNKALRDTTGNNSLVKWHHVDDALPEVPYTNEQADSLRESDFFRMTPKVIVYFNCGTTLQARYGCFSSKQGNCFFEEDAWSSDVYEDVVYWAYLPTPPSELLKDKGKEQ